MRWKVKNGLRTLFWEDKLLGDFCLANQSMRLLTDEEWLLTVASYWRECGGWRWDLIGDNLPASTLLKLAETRLSPNLEEEDVVG